MHQWHHFSCSQRLDVWWSLILIDRRKPQLEISWWRYVFKDFRNMLSQHFQFWPQLIWHFAHGCYCLLVMRGDYLRTISAFSLLGANGMLEIHFSYTKWSFWKSLSLNVITWRHDFLIGGTSLSGPDCSMVRNRSASGRHFVCAQRNFEEALQDGEINVHGSQVSSIAV